MNVMFLFKKLVLLFLVSPSKENFLKSLGFSGFIILHALEVLWMQLISHIPV